MTRRTRSARTGGRTGLDFPRLHERVLELHRKVKLRDARKIHQRVLGDENPHAHRLFGRTALAHQMFEVAAKLFAKSIHLGVDAAEVHNDLGVALLGAGKLAEAKASFAEALAREGRDAMFLRNLARVLSEEGDLLGADTALREAIDCAPDDVNGRVDLAEVLLRRGEPREALSQLETALERKPHPTRILALESVALCELEDHLALAELVDPARFVRCIEAARPDAFESTAAVNAALRKYVVAHRTLARDPRGLSTQGGFHTIGNLLLEEAPIVGQMERLVRSAVAEYVASVDWEGDHPFLARRCDAFRLEGWAVKLQRQGFQESHVHRDGWLSGVYYAGLEGVVREGDPAHEGWLEFGPGPAHLYARRTSPPVHRVQPREGMFAIFPSWFWHRTVPFGAHEDRTSFAFDVIPLS